MKFSILSSVARITLFMLMVSLMLFSFVSGNRYSPIEVTSAIVQQQSDGLNVNITYPTDGASTDPDFTLTAITFNHNSQLNSNTNAAANCDWQLDGGSFNAMQVTGGPSHSTAVSSLDVGEHTIVVQCADNFQTFLPPLLAAIPRAEAQLVPSDSVTFTVVSPLEVIIDYPTNSAVTDPDFTLEAHTIYNGNVNGAADTHCTWSLDSGAPDDMSGFFNPSHEANVSGLAGGEHSITVDCDDNLIEEGFIPAAYAFNTASATVNFTVGTPSTNTGGGSNYYRTCQNNMCTWVMGVGTDSCTSDSQCAAAPGNSNLNTSDTGGTVPDNNNDNGSGGAPVPPMGGGEIDYGGLIADRCNLDEMLKLNFSKNPDMYISRGDFVEMLMFCEGGVDASLADQNPFPDVDKTKHYAAAITKAWQMKVIEGYPDGKFRPEQTINRVEALRVILNFLFGENSVTGGTMDFKDTEPGQWYEKYVAFAQMKGMVSGYRDAEGNLTGFFGPGDGVTYSQAAKMYGVAKGW